jgi:predicted kinase|tara:strand:- start:745 stop:1806 length:1062 start_codon:yes stop_codon:yes gene_type:complete
MDILNYKEETLVLDEGINDPGIFKAIVLAGGPGSGKGYVANKLGLQSLGLRVVNSDSFFEMLMKRKGLSLKMPADEGEAREVARTAAKALTDKRLQMTVAARLGVIIDSTSGDQKKSGKIIKMLKKSGYDVKVIFIQTSLETAKKRNQDRSRTVPEKVLEFSWNGAQKAKTMLKRLVGTRDYHEIENEFDGKIDVSSAGKFTVWATSLNQTALEWILAVKNGNNSVETEDININTSMNSFKEFSEALSIQQRMKMGRTAKRTAKKRARSAKIKAKRMKSGKELQAKAAKMARDKIAKKMSGGKSLSTLTIPQKVMLGKKLDKMKGKIQKLTKKMLIKARQSEKERIRSLRSKS